MLVTTALVSCVLLLISMFQAGNLDYNSEIRQWRHMRETELISDEGWLTVAGLFWLKEGSNSIGSDRSNEIVLPRGAAPPKLGILEFHDGVTTFHPQAGAMTVEGQPAGPQVLKADTSGAPDLLRVGRLTLFIIQRGSQYAVRLRDTKSEMRLHFAGLKYYPPKPEYRVKATFTPYDAPKLIKVANVLGQIEEKPSPGYVEFTLSGRTLRLDATIENGDLFFMFKDLTSGSETYPSGRFLHARMPAGAKAGEIILDFNKAYNPPCAFTPYATCPLPPRQNQLPVRMEAGELRYQH
jgi:uncharacterized protein